ncbi:hypothetical protein P3G55_14460 [Leptospira sp. 96542]|nr:hypothetical protein [Leptospira sp. 96542]
MNNRAPSATFIQNCTELLSGNDGEYYAYRYYEFINGGDEMYASNAPIDQGEWIGLTVAKQTELAEQMLNVPSLNIRYPGTFSGPATKDLQMFVGLDRLESLTGDFMQVESYRKLLELPNLDEISFDVYAHSSGYKMGIWSVMDVLLGIHTEGFHGKLKGLIEYKKKLYLEKSLPILQNDLSETESQYDDFYKFLKDSITEEFLYKNYGR